MTPQEHAIRYIRYLASHYSRYNKLKALEEHKKDTEFLKETLKDIPVGHKHRLFVCTELRTYEALFQYLQLRERGHQYALDAAESRLKNENYHF